jgi:hypothetical protein
MDEPEWWSEAGALPEEEVPPGDIEAAWSAEIARRIAEIDAGQVRLVPWSEVLRRLSG